MDLRWELLCNLIFDKLMTKWSIFLFLINYCSREIEIFLFGIKDDGPRCGSVPHAAGVRVTGHTDMCYELLYVSQGTLSCINVD